MTLRTTLPVKVQSNICALLGVGVCVSASDVLSCDFESVLKVRPIDNLWFALISSLSPPFSVDRVLGWIIQLNVLRSTWTSLTDFHTFSGPRVEEGQQTRGGIAMTLTPSFVLCWFGVVSGLWLTCGSDMLCGCSQPGVDWCTSWVLSGCRTDLPGQ